MNLEKMEQEHKKIVIEMVHDFYDSDAVCHKVPDIVIENSFKAAIEEDNGFYGFIIKNEDVICGFAYVTEFFATEVGGFTWMVEEIFIKKEYRNRGYGKKFFEYIKNNAPSKVKRFRLEVNCENVKVLNFYRSLGYKLMDYGQMIIDIN